jgi:hypothetical protein
MIANREKTTTTTKNTTMTQDDEQDVMTTTTTKDHDDDTDDKNTRHGDKQIRTRPSWSRAAASTSRARWPLGCRGRGQPPTGGPGRDSRPLTAARRHFAARLATPATGPGCPRTRRHRSCIGGTVQRHRRRGERQREGGEGETETESRETERDRQTERQRQTARERREGTQRGNKETERGQRERRREGEGREARGPVGKKAQRLGSGRARRPGVAWAWACASTCVRERACGFVRLLCMSVCVRVPVQTCTALP